MCVSSKKHLELPDYCVCWGCSLLNLRWFPVVLSEHRCPGATCGSGGVPIEFVYLVYFVGLVYFVYLVYLVCFVCFVLCQLYESTLWSFLTVVHVMVVGPFPRPYGGDFPRLRIPKGSPRELRSERTMVFT